MPKNILLYLEHLEIDHPFTLVIVRKLIILFVLCSCLVTSKSYARFYISSIGLGGGTINGLIFSAYLNANRPVDFNWTDSLALKGVVGYQSMGLFNRNDPAPAQDINFYGLSVASYLTSNFLLSERVSVNFGPGLNIGVSDFSRQTRNVRQSWRYVVGLSVAAGIEFTIFNWPIVVDISYMPQMNIIDNGQLKLGLMYWVGYIGLRYVLE